MVNQVNNNESAIEKEIASSLPDATREQLQRFAREVKLNQQIQEFLRKYPEDKLQCVKNLEIAKKCLDYKRPYRLAVIGTTGVGKSTLLNAILGRLLVLMKDTGGAATGCVIEIFLDAETEEQETVKIVYRSKSDIYELIKVHFLKPYGINDFELEKKPLDLQLAQEILSLKPTRILNEDEQDKFKELQEVIQDLINQYTNHSLENLRTDYSLADADDRRELDDLIDEHGDRNTNPRNRIISLVKTVTFHIKPMVDAHIQTLKLPNNVCLVDLPGLDGSLLHNIIITEGIREADAVICLINPRQVLNEKQKYIYNRVKQYINLDNNLEAGERIFLVLTAKDNIMVDDPVPPEERMENLMDMLHPEYKTRFATKAGDKPYFFISAWAALYAQQSLRGEMDENRRIIYKTTKQRLGVSDSIYDSTEQDKEALEKSDVPKLVNALIVFAKEFRIERQIEDGKSALQNIIQSLSTEYQFQKRRLPSNYSESYIQQQLELELKKKQHKLELIVINFRIEQSENFAAINNVLKNEAVNICTKVNNTMKNKIAQIWEENFQAKIDPLTGKPEAIVFFKSILGEFQSNLWEQLTIYLPELADKLVTFYREALGKYQMASKITNGCYGYVEKQDIEQIIRDLVENNMRHTMVNIASRISLTEMTDPKYYFNDFKKPENQAFLTILQNIPLQQEVTADKFNDLIQQVRKLYESFVLDYSISRLLNLYRYEMITIEKNLLSHLKDVFYHLRTSDNSVLMAEIHNNLDPQLKELQKLETKIAQLNQIKEKY